MKRAIALGAGLLAASALGTGWTIARRLTAPLGPRAFDLTIHDIEHDSDGYMLAASHAIGRNAIIDDLLLIASRCLLQAKAAGGNQVLCCP